MGLFRLNSPICRNAQKYHAIRAALARGRPAGPPRRDEQPMAPTLSAVPRRQRGLWAPSRRSQRAQIAAAELPQRPVTAAAAVATPTSRCCCCPRDGSTPGRRLAQPTRADRRCRAAPDGPWGGTRLADARQRPPGAPRHHQRPPAQQQQPHPTPPLLPPHPTPTLVRGGNGQLDVVRCRRSWMRWKGLDEAVPAVQ